MKTKIFVVLTAFIMGMLLLPLAGQAITISPPLIELDANKGDVISQILKVRNENNAPATYYLTAERFVAGGEEGAPSFVGEDVGLATWINFPVEAITIPAGGTIEVPFTINIPSFAGPGGHYAAIFLSNIPPDKRTGDSQVQIASKIGSLVLVRIAGEIVEGAEVREFKTAAETYNSLPVNFEARIENTGNVHVKPMGTILIKNMFGSIAGQATVNEKGGNVLPKQTRRFDANWQKNPNAGQSNTFWGKYRQQKENYVFGKYTAEMTLAYGTAGKVLTAKTSFWVIPWHVLIVNSVILILIVVILYFAVKKYNKWLLKKYAKAQKSAKK